MAQSCELCCCPHPKEIWRDALVYVIDAASADLPGYIRVILAKHIAEMSDLSAEDRHHIMDVVNVVESCMRRTMHPDKVNLAEFGNMVPHLHWHVIARFKDDPFFPESTWGQRQRETAEAVLAARRESAKVLLKELPTELEGIRR